MDRRSARCWAAVVLPGLLLRALIPVGFMPMFGPGRSVSLMLCPAYAPVPTVPSGVPAHTSDHAAAGSSMDMSMDMGMDMPMDTPAASPAGDTHSEPTSGGDPNHQDHSSYCPYRASATLAGIPTLFGVAAAEQTVTRIALPLPQISYFAIAPRAQSARAPPARA